MAQNSCIQGCAIKYSFFKLFTIHSRLFQLLSRQSISLQMITTPYQSAGYKR